MTNMRYKTFKWPFNPSSFSMNYEKRIIRHEFPDVDGAELEELGTEPRIISGTGAFFGKDAYSNFIKLHKLYFEKTTGKLYHPKYGSFNVKFTKLSAKEESLPNYVQYDFEFIEDKEINVIKVNKPKADTSLGKLTILKSINLWKRVNGKLVMVRVLKPKEVYSVYGEDDEFGGQYNVGGGLWVTKIDGYVKYSPKSSNSSSKSSSSSSSSGNKNRYYTVINGDTLGKISKKYYGNSNSWKKIADANKNLIKNPNVLKIGWKLLIP